MARRRNAWLTPDSTEAGEIISRLLSVPLPYLPHVAGALSALTEPQNWEQVGDIEPLQASAAMAAMLEAWMAVTTITEAQATAVDYDQPATATIVGTVLELEIPRGEPGPQGEAGEQGPQGVKGDTGEQGSVGPQGLQGPTGLTGPQGAVGPAGSQGPQGEQGPQGPQGLQGPTGEAGADGDCSCLETPEPIDTDDNEILCGIAFGITDRLDILLNEVLDIVDAGANVAQALISLVGGVAVGIPGAMVANEASEWIVEIENLTSSAIRATLTTESIDAARCDLYCRLRVAGKWSFELMSEWAVDTFANSGLNVGLQMWIKGIDTINASAWKFYAYVGSLEPQADCLGCDCPQVENAIISFESPGTVYSEAGGTHNINIVLNLPESENQTDYEIWAGINKTGGDANNPADYELSDEIVVFPAGSVDGDVQTIVMTIHDDAVDDDNEHVEFTLQLVFPYNEKAELGEQITHTVEITDNDSAPLGCTGTGALLGATFNNFNSLPQAAFPAANWNDWNGVDAPNGCTGKPRTWATAANPAILDLGREVCVESVSVIRTKVSGFPTSDSVKVIINGHEAATPPFFANCGQSPTAAGWANKKTRYIRFEQVTAGQNAYFENIVITYRELA